jgi:hypothetical protein
MNIQFENKDAMARAIGQIDFLTHCPKCREIVNRIKSVNCTALADEPFWPGYAEFGYQLCYCPNCRLLLECWFRRRDNDSTEAELDLTLWSQNERNGRWESNDKIFGGQRNVESIEKVNKLAKENGSFFRMLEFFRSLSGPRYARDEERFSVAIPLACRNREEADRFVLEIKNRLQKRRSGTLEKVEVCEGVLWAHFWEKFGGSYWVHEMWSRGVLPVDLTLWKYNQGRHYQSKAWDHSTSAPATYPSRLRA